MHKGIYTFDLLFAVLIVLLMFYFATIAISEFRDELFLMNSEFSGKTKAFLVSEKLISRELAFSNTQTYQNYIEPERINLINTTKYLADFKISSINVTLLSPNSTIYVSEGKFNKPNTFCYNRIVLVKGRILDSPGIIQICVQNQ